MSPTRKSRFCSNATIFLMENYIRILVKKTSGNSRETDMVCDTGNPIVDTQYCIPASVSYSIRSIYKCFVTDIKKHVILRVMYVMTFKRLLQTYRCRHTQSTVLPFPIRQTYYNRMGVGKPCANVPVTAGSRYTI